MYIRAVHTRVIWLQVYAGYRRPTRGSKITRARAENRRDSLGVRVETLPRGRTPYIRTPFTVLKLRVNYVTSVNIRERARLLTDLNVQYTYTNTGERAYSYNNVGPYVLKCIRVSTCILCTWGLFKTQGIHAFSFPAHRVCIIL